VTVLPPEIDVISVTVVVPAVPPEIVLVTTLVSVNVLPPIKVVAVQSVTVGVGVREVSRGTDGVLVIVTVETCPDGQSVGPEVHCVGPPD